MPQFKVGDRVRDNDKPNDEAVVIAVSRGNITVRWDDTGMTGEWPADEFILSSSSPVRTVTRQEIVPGVYGRLHVAGPDGTWAGRPILAALIPHDEPDHIPPFRAAMSAPELRAAAATFLALADALDPHPGD